MSVFVAYSIVEGKNIASSIAAAFAVFRERAARFAALVFPDSFRPNPQVTPLICQELERAGAIEVLVLVQSGTSIGFVASSVGLRSPRVRIVTARRVEDIDPSSMQMSPLSSPLAVHEVPVGVLLEAGITSAFDLFRSRGARNAAIVFPRSVRLVSTITAILADALNGAPTVRMFFLVHEGSAAGFVAAAVGLRVPHVRVRAMTTVAGVERFLQFTGGGSSDSH